MRYMLIVCLVFSQHIVFAQTNDILEVIRASVSAVVDELPVGRNGSDKYVREFGIKTGRLRSYPGLVLVVSNHQDFVCANFSRCATNEISKLVLMSAWWGGGHQYYIGGMSRFLDMASSGTISKEDLNWYGCGHRSEILGNSLALHYNEPGVSNIVLRLRNVTGDTNACDRILSGEARSSVSNYLEQVSH